eukprot:SAG11_NODE_362_length_10182_cov_9.886641_1_plen_36_part_00
MPSLTAELIALVAVVLGYLFVKGAQKTRFCDNCFI